MRQYPKEKRMRRGWTLIEMLFVLVFLGIFGVLGSLTLLKIYQNYHWNHRNFSQEIQVQNALLQIKHLLENSHLASLMLKSGEEIGINLSSIKGKSLMFYEKAQEYAIVGDYALPCLHGIFEPKSIKFHKSSDSLELEFLNLNPKSNGLLNQKCSLYKAQNMPQKALFITSDFMMPKDFYQSKFQGRILNLNANKISLKIPQVFKDSTSSQIYPNPILPSQTVLNIAPKIYFLNTISYLHFGDSIDLQSQSQFPEIPQNTQQILENMADFKIAKTPLGIALELCVSNMESTLHCASTLVVELER